MEGHMHEREDDDCGPHQRKESKEERAHNKEEKRIRDRLISVDLHYEGAKCCCYRVAVLTTAGH
jgi:hypothetical protein